ncbi:unnamed protein product [Thlaspi arvense]|uniref:MATH domain-containing protein n=1 Tax=Thlaspi arvense TaxID=13288 RepID=A0AAU9SN45_THLAR|nr:unnamed protein product [Thlaspi arvense]
MYTNLVSIETDAQRFHLFKQQWGQLNFLEIGYYQNPAYGFIFDGGQSVFGVDILVANPFEQWEVFSYEENIRDPGYVKAKLRVLDQIRSTHVEKQVEGWPSATENGWGIEKFIPLADIKDASRGFVVDDTLKVQVEILSFSKTDSL